MPYCALALSGAQIGAADYYPPLLTGMRGSHKGSFEVAHGLARYGKRPTEYTRVDDEYDLVVVGGGISGLAAAYLYRKEMGDDAKILVLDNHDDFGGHAKRNEFNSNGKMLLGFGGSINLEQSAMSLGALALLAEIGVEFKTLQNAGADDYALSNAESPYGIFLAQKLQGKNQIVAGPWAQAWAGTGDYRAMINTLSVYDDDKAKLINLASGAIDYVADISLPDKEKYLRSITYTKFLQERIGLSLNGVKLFEPWVRAMFGVGNASVSAWEAIEVGSPGLYSLGLPDSITGKNSETDSDAYRTPIFPDGNATVARLLVRKLIPSVAAGNTMQDVVTAKFDYSQLDRDNTPVRVRLNSTAVNVVNSGKDAVDISYVCNGDALQVRAKHCILAGYNGMIPHLCPELPPAQKEHLAYGVKAPFVWANVVLKTSKAVQQGDASVYFCAGSFFELVAHAPPVTLGDYHIATDPQDPMVMFMGHMPAPEGEEGQSGRDLFRLGRHKMLVTPFSDYEKAIREQLIAMFGRFGFDADRDIEAITVNRWSHGYAYEYMDLHDPKWKEGQAPHELGRKPLGCISIANSDSEAYAYVQAAIDAAIRAVGEVTV